MIYKELGNTGIKVSAIGLGTWQIGGPATLGGNQIGWGEVSESDGSKILNTAFDNGITFFDTADVYGNGRSEELIGKTFKGRRDQIVIASKYGNREDAEGKWFKDLSAEWAVECLEGSLKRLQTDYLDFYMMHSPGADYDLDDEVITALDKMVSAGKIRHWGVSLIPYGRGILPGDQGVRLSEESKSCEFFELRYNLLERDPEDKFFPHCIENKKGVIARVPLASGFLTGKYNRDTTFPANDQRSGFGKEKIADFAEKAQKLSFLAEELNTTPAMAALKFCIQHEAVSSVIPGGKTPEQVIQNTKAADLPDLTPEMLAKINEIVPMA